VRLAAALTRHVDSEADLQRDYIAALERHGYGPDPAQQRAVQKLDALARRLRADAATRHPPLSRLLRRLGRGVTPTEAGARGVYLQGGVGRGKTFLMDLFHAHVGVPARRDHFHRFMKDVHAQLGTLRDTSDPLVTVAAGMARDMRVLCLDELFVSDIADAMLLAGLFEGLVRHGVTLVFTSNARPAELYRDGLQRQRFLPAIALIEQHTELVEVDGGQDYRLRQLRSAPLYLDASRAESRQQLTDRFRELADVPAPGPRGTIEVEGRAIPYVAATDEVAWFDFDTLCAGPRSQADYIELARDYHTILVSDVPRLGAAQDNEARRFIALVDEFYDRGVKLVLSAHVPPDELYAGDRLRFEFERTRSRLAEMQTEEYLARPHKA
jgi:cell division protein ZapE